MLKRKRGRPPKSHQPKKAKAKAGPDTSLEYQEALQEDPLWFIEEEILGSPLWEDQRKIVLSVRDNFNTAWRSCHGIGKSHVVARLVLWWLYSFPYSLVITTAPSWRQVEDVLWKEIRAAYFNSKKPLGGNLAPSATQLSLFGKQWMAIGISTNDSNRLQGYHAEHLLFIEDEASGVDEDINEASMGILTSAHCRRVLIGNPTDIGSHFYRAFKNPEGWSIGKTAAWDTPNFTTFGITRDDILNNTWAAKVPRNPDGGYAWPYPGLITPKWAYDALLEWGVNHPAWFARVEGDFPEGGEYNVIPLSWIERAQDRYDKTEVKGQPILGVDVARGGMDNSVIAARVENKIVFIQSFSSLDTQQLAGEVMRIYRELDARVVNVEEDGLGAGVIDELKKHRDISRNDVMVGSGSEIRDPKGNRVYGNLRAEMWWALRNALDPKGDMPLALPPKAKRLAADLAAPKYDYRNGPIQIERKEDTKARLGRSPDEGDAVMLTFAPLMKKPSPRLVMPRAAETVTPAWKISGYGR
jgi:phage terminase large subunit